MELELKSAAGIESCFVSLPLSFIRTLQSTCAGVIPHFLALELQFPDNRIWHVAWIGSASSSSAIEVGQHFADCLEVYDHTIVKVRAVCNLPEAKQIVIDPDTSDDWEVMELNAERAETSLLAQVGIVCKGMRFPLWLSGGAVARFIVVSISPQKSVVRLVPGTEVVVAPKKRTRNTPHTDSSAEAYKKDKIGIWAQLRIQEDSTRVFTHTATFKGVELGISVTSVAFVNPKTAKSYLMDSLQSVVIFPRSEKRTATSGYDRNMLKKTTVLRDSNAPTRNPNQTVVHLLFSENVSEGHIMISSQLITFLAVDLHSWVFLKCYNESSLSDISSISLSPCHFKPSNDDRDLDTNAEIQLNKADTTRHEVKKDTFNDIFDFSILEEFVSHIPFASSNQLDEESTIHPQYISRLLVLVQAWFSSQLSFIECNSRGQTKSLVLGSQTLLHIEVKGFELKQRSREKKSVAGLLVHENGAEEISVDIFYILTLSSGVSHDGQACGYEFVINSERMKDDLGGLDFPLGKMKFGDVLSLSSVGQISHNKCFIPPVFSLTWMEENVSLVVNRLAVMLSLESQSWYSDHNVPLPGHILIHGPHGSGKTSLSRAVANVLEQSTNILAHIVFICCSKLASEKAQVMNSAFSEYISEALCHVPSLVVFDDIDSIILAPSDFRGFLHSSPDHILSDFLCEIMDEYAVKRKMRCGIGPIAFLATAQSLENVPNALRSSGRFDFHVQLPSFSVQQRGAILKCELEKRSLQCSDDTLSAVSSKCDGYDAYDLEILADRAVHAAVGRLAFPCSTSEICDTPILDENDFSQAMHGFLPISMRDVAKHSSEGIHSGWEDVGGLFEVRNAIKEMIELPSKFPGVYSQSPLRMRSNALLYGPPGCGKTYIVGAAASACSLRFLSVRGPELLNKYIGASEQAVRDIFSKAASAAPCLLFFDEFDSIAPSRGHDNTGVTDRVVNQFLTELDGVEALVGVFVFAATSRPDLLDTALLRPGRLDRLLLCDFPSQSERLDILNILSRKVKMEDEVDLKWVAAMTEGYSGADLESIFSDARLKVVNDWVSDGGSRDPNICPPITDRLLKSLTCKSRRSVSEAERSRLSTIYGRFRDSRSTAQIDEVKGKRVTLA